MRPYIAIRTLVCAIAVTGCADTRTTAPLVPVDAVVLQLRAFPEPIASFIVAGRTLTRERRIVRDAQEWAAVWEALTSSMQPQPPVPAVDFEQEMVILATMGAQSATGFAIQIEAAHETADRLFVSVREIYPNGTCVNGAAVTAPSTAVRVRRRALPATYIEHSLSADC